MTTAGPVIADVLNNLKGELEANASAQAQNDRRDIDAILDKHKSQNDITHHYKVTKTQSIEFDDSHQDRNETDNEHTKDKTKKKRRGCFSSCFGRKG